MDNGKIYNRNYLLLVSMVGGLEGISDFLIFEIETIYSNKIYV